MSALPPKADIDWRHSNVCLLPIADIDGDRHVGRIMLHPQPPEGQPWFWTITAPSQTIDLQSRLRAKPCEQAMAAARWAMRDG
jgi:hypothetical protein